MQNIFFFNTGGTECTREKEDEVLVKQLDDEALEKLVEEQKVVGPFAT